MPVEGPDATELPECVSKNATRSRSLDVGGRVMVEAARAEVLGLIRMSVAVVVCRHARNRKGGRNALVNAFLAALVSIKYPYVSSEKLTLVGCQQGRRQETNPSRYNPKPDVHVIVPVPWARNGIILGRAQPQAIGETGGMCRWSGYGQNNYHCLITLRWSWNVYKSVWGMCRVRTVYECAGGSKMKHGSEKENAQCKRPTSILPPYRG